MAEANDDQITTILDLVKQAGINKRDILSDDEFKNIVEMASS